MFTAKFSQSNPKSLSMKKNNEKNAGQIANEIFALLENQDKEHANRILASVATLLGVTPPAAVNGQAGNGEGSSNGQTPLATVKDAKAFFTLKKPETIGEEFAVAAKFRVDNSLGETHTKADIKETIADKAKRNFADNNFSRDMVNAIRQAKFFIRGKKKGDYVLSALGEAYVDALPDRTAAAESRNAHKPSKRAKKKAAKKASKK
ncbi:hypothetical protein [Puia dinghuensis]|uniref:Uncharacterized protein n=1 Tax=Puia dinghuensis TaxID=1792502 RepID=A0A8J2UD53_9BACT|nr:hypothetical protein [Puia dinghuensis]GGB01419.1 hypothetical protein GCM10011511_25920 [Puia dinghuensis]